MKSDMFDECDAELLASGYKVQEEKFGIEIGRLSIKSNSDSKKFNKPLGEYRIINCPKIHLLDRECFEYCQNIFDLALSEISSFDGDTLVVGLGNPDLVADSLGAKVVSKLIVNGAFEKFTNNKKVRAIVPDVYLKTGIKTEIIISAIVKQIKPKTVVLIDSLGTYLETRIANSFQITTSGIVPGGALYEGNAFLSKDFLSTDVVVIGVPLLLVNKEAKSPLTGVLCPKNIEEYVQRCSRVIANSLNAQLHKK